MPCTNPPDLAHTSQPKVYDPWANDQDFALYFALETGNSHSILMMDTSGNVTAEVRGWDNAHAEIHFSLKTIAGRSYLLKVKERLDELTGIPDAVKLEGRSGEYDVVIRCPATVLGKELYGPGGIISYGNLEYQRNVYQSETIVYPFGCSDMDLYATNSTDDIQCNDTLSDVVKKAIEEMSGA